HNPEHNIDYALTCISHAHLDHMGFLSHMHYDIPILCSKPTYAIMRTLQEAGAGSDKDFITFKEYYVTPSKRQVIDRQFHFIEDGPLSVGDLVFRGVPVDHSLPGAAGFIIETPKGNVGYTGDFRFHGSHKKLTRNMVKVFSKANLIALITEGTNIDETPDMSEAKVYRKILNAAKKTKGLIAANFPKRDTARLDTFLRVAKETGRKLAIDMHQAYELKCLYEAGCSDVSIAINPNAGDEFLRDLFDADIVVFAKQKKDGSVLRGEPLEKVVKDYSKWERQFIASNHGTDKKPALVKQEYVRDAHQIRNRQDKYIVFSDNFSVQNLIDFQPVEGSLYVYSKTEPFDQEMEADFDKLENWVRKFFGSDQMLHAHASGHAYGRELVNAIKEINPGIVIPTHTQHPEMFIEKLTKRDNRLKHKEPYKGKVIVPELSVTGNAHEIML
ncbi:hypothetical protein HON01_07890, partial [Candidatus Woesearchaeota archaeon]|nr:hypothetical protein [Candidatus Woesearchaeota archaeon]